MRIRRYITTGMLLVVFKLLSAQLLHSDSTKMEVCELDDSLEFKVTVSQIETQLTFLMQGLDILVTSPDSLSLSFPSAAMVRNKVKRHPNEVKAVLAQKNRQEVGHDSTHRVVRPDVQPLVAALNDTTAIITFKGEKEHTRNFRIVVDREKAIMTFNIRIAKNLMPSAANGPVTFTISSAPSIQKGNSPEFVGRRLSGENAPQPNGLGEGIRKEDVSKRTFRKQVTIRAEKCNVR